MRPGVPRPCGAPGVEGHGADERAVGGGVGERATVHGFRSTFSDWSAEQGNAPMLAEAALAHVVQGWKAPIAGPTCLRSEGR